MSEILIPENARGQPDHMLRSALSFLSGIRNTRLFEDVLNDPVYVLTKYFAPHESNAQTGNKPTILSSKEFQERAAQALQTTYHEIASILKLLQITAANNTAIKQSPTQFENYYSLPDTNSNIEFYHGKTMYSVRLSHEQSNGRVLIVQRANSVTIKHDYGLQLNEQRFKLELKQPPKLQGREGITIEQTKTAYTPPPNSQQRRGSYGNSLPSEDQFVVKTDLVRPNTQDMYYAGYSPLRPGHEIYRTHSFNYTTLSLMQILIGQIKEFSDQLVLPR